MSDDGRFGDLWTGVEKAKIIFVHKTFFPFFSYNIVVENGRVLLKTIGKKLTSYPTCFRSRLIPTEHLFVIFKHSIGSKLTIVPSATTSTAAVIAVCLRSSSVRVGDVFKGEAQGAHAISKCLYFTVIRWMCSCSVK